VWGNHLVPVVWPKSGGRLTVALPDGPTAGSAEGLADDGTVATVSTRSDTSVGTALPVVDLGGWKLRDATSMYGNGVNVGRGRLGEHLHGFILVPIAGR
jgi:hypothetical protein